VLVSVVGFDRNVAAEGGFKESAASNEDCWRKKGVVLASQHSGISMVWFLAALTAEFSPREHLSSERSYLLNLHHSGVRGGSNPG
jgi:hypothetical protein